MNAQIAVQVWKNDGDGPFLASARVIISTDWGDITLDRLRVIQKDNKQPWVALPQVSYQKDGKTLYKDIIRLPLRLKSLVDERIFKELGISH